MEQELSTTKTGGHTCPWWLLFTFDNPLRRLVHDPQKILRPYVRPGDTVLDVGCGMGFFSLGLAELVGKDGKVLAADLQEQMLAGLKKRAENAGVWIIGSQFNCTSMECIQNNARASGYPPDLSARLFLHQVQTETCAHQT